jgi:AhpD family alkylhydroperoxidase
MLKTLTFAALALAALVTFTAPAAAQDVPDPSATYADIQATLGTVPSHIKGYPPQAVAGAWEMTKGLLFDPSNAIDPKTKSLIGLAVAAQIPCQYCIWLETKFAKQQGATDAEVAEAVAQAGYVRMWSTVINGLQIDFETFKAEFGGE